MTFYIIQIHFEASVEGCLYIPEACLLHFILYVESTGALLSLSFY